MSKLTFDLDRKEQEVEIGGEAYVLVELDGKQRDKWMNDLGARIRLGKDGKAQGLKSFDNMQAGLISASLKKIVGDERKPVSMETIQSWPARVSGGLFDAAKELSGLEDESDKDSDEGND